ncbi:hypothetical protein EV193_11945 [Herbihabitans rhizosphaerae]|uniref:Transcriptional regulator, AbiEi antitoxin, Type IV TA system n=1 Tax=Herbihabitans rhizosphaerae TaxID=1872711 RepID=A0A4Q7KBN5_9PSEU|nr:hypothetical protein [Herbihabitans rhizosphaerae]RZS29642.1 hypothetical protein EV193_11945 [Herbihabitans rhizosphaerae]
MTQNRAVLDLEAVADLFPHRVARLSELLELGITSRAVLSRLKPGGPWRRLLSGVVLLDDARPSRAQMIQAALRYAGPDAVVTGPDALQLYDLRTPHGTNSLVHLLVPHRRQVRGEAQILVERTHKLPEPLSRNDFPVAPLPRAALDTARRLTSREEVGALLGEVIRRGRVNPSELLRELDRGSRRGTALPRSVLIEFEERVTSVAEGWARRLLTRAGLPHPRWSVPLRVESGHEFGTVDAWWPDLGVVWDLDGFDFHPTPANAAAAVRRVAELRQQGLIVVHSTIRRLKEESASVIQELRTAHTVAAGNPTPPVIAA